MDKFNLICQLDVKLESVFEMPEKLLLIPKVVKSEQKIIILEVILSRLSLNPWNIL